MFLCKTFHKTRLYESDEKLGEIFVHQCGIPTLCHNNVTLASLPKNHESISYFPLELTYNTHGELSRYSYDVLGIVTRILLLRGTKIVG